MNMKFDRLYLSNFMSFSDCGISLSDNGFVRVTGENNNKEDNSKSNGSGKSALWEAISWCLTGTTIRGSKDVVRHGEDSCLVSLRFTADSDEYEITRSKDKSKSGLTILKNGEDVSGKGIRDTEELLSQYLPDLTPSLINSIIILGQGLPMRFTNNTPAGRKEVLEKLSKSDFMIEDLKERVSKRRDVLYAKSQSVKNELTQLNTAFDIYEGLYGRKLNELDGQKSLDIESLLEESAKLELRIEENTEELQSIFAEMSSDTVQDWVVAAMNEKMEFTKSYNDLANDVSRSFQEENNELYNSIKDIESSIRYKSAEIDRLKSVKDVCPTCGQKLPNIHKVDATSLENEVSDLREKLENEKAELAKKTEIKERTLSEINEKYNSGLEELNKKIETATEKRDRAIALQSEIERVRSRMDEIGTSIQNRNNNIKSLTEELENLSMEIDIAKENAAEKDNELTDLESRIEVQKEFETALKRDFRGILLQNCISYIDGKAKQYSQELFETDLLKFELDGNNISISYNGKEYESLSGGERKKVDVIIQFAIRSMLCEYMGFSCNILVLDEIFDELDNKGCQKVIDFISNELVDINSVYIISHRSDLDIPADSELVVVKNEMGISNVLG